jgi:hypothetical protein
MKRQATVLNEANGRISYRFHARDLHLVMGPAARGSSVRFRVLIDGEPPGTAHGIDVEDQGNGTVSEQRLYQLIRQPKPIADQQFEIEFLDSGVEALRSRSADPRQRLFIRLPRAQSSGNPWMGTTGMGITWARRS